jgi:hypothetical protein
MLDLLRDLRSDVFSGWNVELGKLTDKPWSIGIMDTGGRAPEPRLMINYPTIQFLAQGDATGDGYPNTWAKLEEIRELILGIPAGPRAYPDLTMCNQTGDISFLGTSDKDFPRFSMNFQLITEPAPVGHRVEA